MEFTVKKTVSTDKKFRYLKINELLTQETKSELFDQAFKGGDFKSIEDSYAFQDRYFALVQEKIQAKIDAGDMQLNDYLMSLCDEEINHEDLPF